MTIHAPFVNGKLRMEDEMEILSSPSVNDLAAVKKCLLTAQATLASYNTDDLIGFFDELGKSWAVRESPVQKRFSNLGINYLLYWFHKDHLEKILNLSLRGNRHVLDEFCECPSSGEQLSAQPRGLICHWLAGNVPMLGMLSLAQGLLTKNANIVKLPRQNGHVLPMLLASFAEVNYRTPGGKDVRGEDIARAVCALYFDREDSQAQRDLSLMADVRVAWGGREAVESVMNLPRVYGCEDVIFGPRTSFAVIGRENLGSADDVRAIAKRLSVDVSMFEQRGCNSPHTVFVEEKGRVSPVRFAELLAEEMGKTANGTPPGEIAGIDTMAILTQRAKCDMTGQAFYPKGMGWSVLYSDIDEGLAVPCHNRTVFVRPIDDVMQVEDFCSRLTQSAGTALAEDRKREFARRVTARGVDRCPEIGAMTAHNAPWDGMFVMDRFVRWCRL